MLNIHLPLSLFHKIKEIWSGFALTDFAKKEIEELQPYLSENELRARMRETSQARQMLEGWGNPPLVSLEAAAPHFPRRSAEAPASAAKTPPMPAP